MSNSQLISKGAISVKETPSFSYFTPLTLCHSHFRSPHPYCIPLLFNTDPPLASNTSNHPPCSPTSISPFFSSESDPPPLIPSKLASMSWRGGRSARGGSTGRSTDRDGTIHNPDFDDCDTSKILVSMAKISNTKKEDKKPTQEKKIPRPVFKKQANPDDCCDHQESTPEPSKIPQKREKPHRHDRDDHKKDRIHQNIAVYNKTFDFENLTPVIPDQECQCCGTAIKIYAGSLCGHTDEYCGECILKLRLFSKQLYENSDNISFNPSTNSEEKNRSMVVLKQSYLDYITEINKKKNTEIEKNAQNFISDPYLDVNYVSYCRSRDTVCLFCHEAITPLLLSRDPVSIHTYRLLVALLKLNVKNASNADITAINTEINDIYTSLFSEMDQEIAEIMEKAGSKKAKKGNVSSTTPSVQELVEKKFKALMSTQFIYNSHLDIYTLERDGDSFCQLIENTCTITCKKCIDSYNDNQSGYNADCLLTLSNPKSLAAPETVTTYQTLPKIEPPVQSIALNYLNVLPTDNELSTDMISTTNNSWLTKELQNRLKAYKFTTNSVFTPISITTTQYRHKSFSSLRQLQKHINDKHHMDICTACYSQSHDFIHTRQLYNHQDLLKHSKKEKHSMCTLCMKQCVDYDELYAHLIDFVNYQHYECRYCYNNHNSGIKDKKAKDSEGEMEKHFFFKGKVEYLIHLYSEHHVCQHDSCKQYDPSPTKPSDAQDPQSVNLNKVRVFGSAFELQQHMTSQHNTSSKDSGALKKGKAINLFEVFHSNKPTNTNVSPVVPGQARGANGLWNSTNGSQDNAKSPYKTTLTVDDVLVYKMAVNMANSNSEITNETSITTTANTNDTFFNGLDDSDPELMRDIKAQIRPVVTRQEYQELFPTLGSSVKNDQPSSLSFSGKANRSAPKKPQELFPTLGKKGVAPIIPAVPDNTKKKEQKLALNQILSSPTSTTPNSAPATHVSSSAATAFPTFGSSKNTSAIVPPAPTPTSPKPKPKNTNLAALMNWGAVPVSTKTTHFEYNTSKALNHPRAVKTPHLTQNYETGSTIEKQYRPDEHYYEPTGNTRSSFTSTMMLSTKNDQDGWNVVNTNKTVTQQDFPSTFGGAAPSVKTSVKEKNQKQPKTVASVFSSTNTAIAPAWGSGVAQQPKSKVANPTKANNMKNDKNALEHAVKGTLLDQMQIMFSNGPELLNQITVIMGNKENKGKKNDIITKQLFSTTSLPSETGVIATSATLFEQYVNIALNCNDITTLLCSKQSLSMFIQYYHFLLVNILSNSNLVSTATKKTIALIFSHINMVFNSVFNNDAVDSISFPPQTKLAEINKSIQQFYINKYGVSNTHIPPLHPYPDITNLSSINIVNNDLSKIKEFTSLINSTAPKDVKKLSEFLLQSSSTKQRLFLLIYLLFFVSKGVSRGCIVYRLINDHLRSVDAQESV